MRNIQNNIDELALRAFNNAVSTKGTPLPLTDLITVKEKIKIGRRILIAQAILAGKTRYEVNSHLSVSPNTFAQTHRWLEGELLSYTSAYKPDVSKIEKFTRAPRQPFSYQHLKKSFPGHFLFISLIEELFTQSKKQK